MHDKEAFLKALKELREKSEKRKFVQSVDLIVTLKSIDLKKSSNRREFFVQVPHALTKPVKICALVGPETYENAKAYCDTVILADDFDKYAKNLRLTRKLAREHDWFIAQANIMAKVAAAFGRVLAPRGKMPNPKVGGVFPPKVDLKSLVDKLRRTVKISVKKKPVVQVRVGVESMKDEETVENAVTVFETLVHNLPNEKNNIKEVLLKFTMSTPVKVI